MKNKASIPMIVGMVALSLGMAAMTAAGEPYPIAAPVQSATAEHQQIQLELSDVGIQMADAASQALQMVPSIPLREGIICATDAHKHSAHGLSLPVWQGNYTNLASVGVGNAEGSWLENLLFLASIMVLGTGLTVLACRPENQSIRGHAVSWRIQLPDSL